MTATYDRLKSELAVKNYVDVTGGAAHFVTATWPQIIGDRLLVGATFCSGTGLSLLGIWAATDNAGAGATLVISDATAITVAGSQLWIETRNEAIIAALAHATYYNVKVTSTGSDVIVVTTVTKPYNPKTGATVTVNP